MIESFFQHRGFDIRIKEHHKDHVMYFVRTPLGPIVGMGKTLIEARYKAVESVNEFTSADWTLNMPRGGSNNEANVSRITGTACK